jgi:hypothetical protein
MCSDDAGSDEADFIFLMKRSGIAVPPDRYTGALYVYRELCRMAQLQRQPRIAEDWPACIFDLSATLRET